MSRALAISLSRSVFLENWSGRGDSNPRPQPWQDSALLNFAVISDVYWALEKSEHDPNIFSGIYSEGFVFNAVAEAAAINDPATLDPVFRFPGKVDVADLLDIAASQFL